MEQSLKLARQGYYDGSAFHRCGGANGIIQGGDPLLKDLQDRRTLWGSGGLNLLARRDRATMKHERGVVSTVRIPNKANSDGAQFFVQAAAGDLWTGSSRRLARVTEGMDVVETPLQVPARNGNHRLKPRCASWGRSPSKRKRSSPTSTPRSMSCAKPSPMKTTLGTLKIQMESPGLGAQSLFANYSMLVETGWYNGTAFHRVIPGFMAQGGMGNTRTGGAAHPADRWVHNINGEFHDDIKHVRGIVSMARTDDPDSATTSFFLMLGPAPHLDGKYSAFGRVVEGMEVLDAFDKEEVDGETPKRRLEIIEAKVD